MIAFSVTLGGHPHVLFSFGLCPDIIVESHSALSKKRLHALHLPLCTIPAISKNAVKSILGLGPTICFFLDWAQESQATFGEPTNPRP